MSGPPFASVWFDCDSTLTAVEGIDELAASFRPRLAEEVATLTARAMDGGVPLESVYAERLALLAPTRTEVEAVGARYVQRVVPGASEVVAALRACGKTVGIVSGGLRPAVAALARHLGIADEHVFAVDLWFDAAGRYRDFDRASPLVRSGGKRAVLAALPARFSPAAFVGDGATDLETKGAAACFVGFGGVVRRARVAAEADVYLAGPRLDALLDVLLAPAELDPSRPSTRP